MYGVASWILATLPTDNCFPVFLSTRTVWPPGDRPGGYAARASLGEHPVAFKGGVLGQRESRPPVPITVFRDTIQYTVMSLVVRESPKNVSSSNKSRTRYLIYVCATKTNGGMGGVLWTTGRSSGCRRSVEVEGVWRGGSAMGESQWHCSNDGDEVGRGDREDTGN